MYEACSGVAAYLEERGCLTEPAAVMQVLDKLDESCNGFIDLGEFRKAFDMSPAAKAQRYTRILQAPYLHASYTPPTYTPFTRFVHAFYTPLTRLSHASYTPPTRLLHTCGMCLRLVGPRRRSRDCLVRRCIWGALES